MFYGYSKKEKKNYYVIIPSIIPFNSFYVVLSIDLKNKILEQKEN